MAGNTTNRTQRHTLRQDVSAFIFYRTQPFHVFCRCTPDFTRVIYRTQPIYTHRK